MIPTESLIPKWQHALNAARDIFTWTEPETLAWLAEHVSVAEHAIEVGVYMGHSSKVMLAANPRLHLWSVDPFMVAGTEFVTRVNLREERKAGRSEIIPKTSPEAAKQLMHMQERIDLIFVDDGHAYEDVIRDIDSFYPLLRPGGLMCGHDFETSPLNDVASAVIHCFAGRVVEPVPRLWAVYKPLET